MKTKVFTFNTGGDYLILALVRTIGLKAWVTYCYSNSDSTVLYSDIESVDTSCIEKWANKNGASIYFGYEEWLKEISE